MKLRDIKDIIKANGDGVLDRGSFMPDTLLQMQFGIVPSTMKSSLSYDNKIIDIIEKDYELINQQHRVNNDKKLNTREKYYIKYQNEGAIIINISTNVEIIVFLFSIFYPLYKFNHCHFGIVAFSRSQLDDP